MTRHGIAARKQRRGHVEHQRSAGVIRRELGKKAAGDMEPRDFVFILVGQQLEERPRHRLGQLRRSRNGPLLRLRRALDKRAIARRQRLVLIVDEFGGADLDDVVESGATF